MLFRGNVILQFPVVRGKQKQNRSENTIQDKEGLTGGSNRDKDRYRDPGGSDTETVKGRSCKRSSRKILRAAR